jgi:capsule polysaccharide export protein KpsC/LpsZ
MNITQCSFKQMMTIAAGNKKLAEATSFVQVEYGIDELRACWDGFVDTSTHYGVEFKTRKHLCEEFANALLEYAEYLQPGTHEMGSAFS